MSNYVQATNFAAKDATQDLIVGAEIDTEFSALASASATKTDKQIPATTGNVAGLDATGNITDSGYTKTFMDRLVVNQSNTKVKTVDTSINTSTTQVIDPHLQGYGLTAGKLYMIEGFIGWIDNGGDLDLKLVSTANWTELSLYSAEAAQAGPLVTNTAADSGELQFVFTDITEAGIHIIGYLDCPVAMTVDMYWAQNVSSVNNTTLHRASWLKFTQAN